MTNVISEQRILPMEPQRDEYGFWTHPDFFEPADGREYGELGEFNAWLEVKGLEYEIDFYERDDGHEDEFGCADWHPSPPRGDGWFIGSIHDTEDYPVCIWLRHLCTCMSCGCTDDHACVDEHDTPCHWVKVDRAAGTGICSQCAPDWLEKLAEDN
ncbi:hypothetical protein [Sodalis sp. RH16]|uniref:hypothetical protein n=1 Tax=Sodalis sp. RH16 TaxID=3394331 RepID=UPI0039B4A250